MSYLCWAVILQSHLINEMKEILGNGETDDNGLLRSRPVCLLSAHLLVTVALDAVMLAESSSSIGSGGGDRFTKV